MHPILRRAARFVGASIGGFAGIVAIQMVRLRRLRFLPPHPGFHIDHLVMPTTVRARVDQTRPPSRLVVFGDSTTAGVGVRRAEEALPYRLAGRVAAATGAPVHVVSYGWAGARAADVATDQLPRALRSTTADRDAELPAADWIAIVVGANDATHRTPPWRFRSDLRKLLASVTDVAPRARVVLAGIPAFRGALRTIEPLIWITDQYARLLRPIAAAEALHAGVAFADLARDVPPRIQGRTDILSEDRFHLSPAGYAVWAEVIAEALVGASPMPAPLPAVTTRTAEG